jgi:CRP-like cAMP-binding protein
MAANIGHPLPVGPLIRKLEALGPLTGAAKAALADLPHTIRQFAPHEVVLQQAAQPANIYLLLNGCVFRSTVVIGGERQIMALHVAGAMLNLQNLFLERMDHAISALVPTTVALIPRSEIRKLFDAHPLVAMRLWHETFIEAAIARKWLTGVGRRTAYASIAHFLSEFVARSKAAGMSDGKTCEFPLTQAELGDALGLSVVHVNRTLKKLSRHGLISWNGRSLTIDDWARLNEVADFDPAYLEL